MDAPTRITVHGARPYDVVVGHGLLGELADMNAGDQRDAIVNQASLPATAEAIL
jgi:3-dehydroquinate synthase